MFSSWSGLVTALLFLCNNGIATFQEDDLGGPCFCKSYSYRSGGACVHVICEGRNVTGFPHNIPASTKHLTFIGTAVVNLTNAGINANYSNVIILSFKNNPELTLITEEAFYGIHNLETLSLTDNEKLSDIEKYAFYGLKKLRILTIFNSYNLRRIKPGVLTSFPSLDTLKISKCGLEEVPDLQIFEVSRPTGIIDMDFSSNKIKAIRSAAFAIHLAPEAVVYALHLNHNPLEVVRNGAFNDSKIMKIKLNSTPLKKIEPLAFVNSKKLEILHLENTKISELPTDGLSFLRELYLQNVPTLEVFPSVLKLLRIEIANLTYASHCCAFRNPEKQYPAEYLKFQEEINKNCSTTYAPTQPLTTVTTPTYRTGFADHVIRRRLFNYPPNDELYYRTNDDNKSIDLQFEQYHFGPDGFLKFPQGNFQDARKGIKRQVVINDDGVDDGERWFATVKEIDPTYIEIIHCGNFNILDNFKSIKCTPQPNALNPCEGVMGYNWLRIVVWFVVTMAVLGNLIVIVVSLCSHQKMTVSKFLMCNLAFSDFTLGSYLLILAIVDVLTLGEYFNYAIRWQYRGGCQFGGFIAVFSQSLSIFTLTIITLERWYAISHAIRLTKRLRLRQAYIIMTCGWGFALITAMLPILSVSSYSEANICLPMKAQSFVDKCYLFFLLTFNTFAFIIILISYVDMFRKVHMNATMARSNDATIAKRMSILVFTDFACLFPVCFFGITAAAGIPLISITQSKILLVLFYPLNSCANPFLYAIFTKQFKKDLFGLLSKHGFCQKQAMKYRGITYSHSHSRNNSLPSSNVNNIVLRTSDGSVLTQLTLDQGASKHMNPGTSHGRIPQFDTASNSKGKKSRNLKSLYGCGYKSRKSSTSSTSSIHRQTRSDLNLNKAVSKKRRLPFIQHGGAVGKKSKQQRHKHKPVSTLLEQMVTQPEQKLSKCEVCQQDCSMARDNDLSLVSTSYSDVKLSDKNMTKIVTELKMFKKYQPVNEKRHIKDHKSGNRVTDQSCHELDSELAEIHVDFSSDRQPSCSDRHCKINDTNKRCNEDENVSEQHTLLIVKDDPL